MEILLDLSPCFFNSETLFSCTLSLSFEDLLTWFGGLVTKSCPTLMTPWTVAHQTPLSTGFSRQEYWIGLPFPSPGDLPDPGTKPRSPTLQADSLPTELGGKPSLQYLILQSHFYIIFPAGWMPF